MKKTLWLFMIFVVMMSAGCSLRTSPTHNVVDISTIDFSTISRMKKQESCAVYILGFIGPFGDVSVIEAIKKGGIRQVQAVEYRGGFYLLYGESCIVVYGSDAPPVEEKKKQRW